MSLKCPSCKSWLIDGACSKPNCAKAYENKVATICDSMKDLYTALFEHGRGETGKRIQLGPTLLALDSMDFDSHHVDTSANRTLPRFPIQICLELGHLSSFALTYQPHIELPERMGQALTNLTSLSLTFDKIGSRSLPDSLWTLSALQTLDLSNNFIKELPQVHKLKSLTCLKLHKNDINVSTKTLPNLNRLKLLNTLTLTGNTGSIERGLAYLPCLTSLDGILPGGEFMAYYFERDIKIQLKENLTLCFCSPLSNLPSDIKIEIFANSLFLFNQQKQRLLAIGPRKSAGQDLQRYCQGPMGMNGDLDGDVDEDDYPDFESLWGKYGGRI